jgi:hypothetical protein
MEALHILIDFRIGPYRAYWRHYSNLYKHKRDQLSPIEPHRSDDIKR